MNRPVWWRAWLREWRLVYGDTSVLLVIAGGVLFYALLYPLPYHRNVPGEQAVAVIDQDRSALSRQLIRMADATPQVRIVARPWSDEQARMLLARGEAHGLLVIPEHFQRDLYLGRPTSLSYAGDASYFLIYGNVVQGLLTAGTTLGVEAQAMRALMQGESPMAIPGEVMPMRLVTKAVFNDDSGYIGYIVPAVFVLILHQTLLITAGCVTVRDRLRGGLGLTAPGLALPLRLSVFVLIYLLLAALYFGFFFHFYEVPRLAGKGALLLVSTLLFVTTGLCALFMGQLLQRPEWPTVVVLVSSLPIVFTAGFVWPEADMPGWVRGLSWLAPAKPGIMALLKLNQMGAGLDAIRPELTGLVVQALGYGGAVVLMARRQAARA
ncbi:ABC transporter permease [Alloalcanivorax xenomutans]|jgi:ABC-2 type transport system permease protein|uniref:ABC transporter permease n=1 Tax=Alloalcanivorax xenomutans TaxID=1094342 RepID=UPI000E37280F